MQSTRLFSGHFLQSCFNFEKSALNISPYACMRVWKRINYFESLSSSCVTFLGMSRTYTSMSPIYFMQKFLTLMKYYNVDIFVFKVERLQIYK